MARSLVQIETGVKPLSSVVGKYWISGRKLNCFIPHKEVGPQEALP